MKLGCVREREGNCFISGHTLCGYVDVLRQVTGLTCHVHTSLITAFLSRFASLHLYIPAIPMHQPSDRERERERERERGREREGERERERERGRERLCVESYVNSR